MLKLVLVHRLNRLIRQKHKAIFRRHIMEPPSQHIKMNSLNWNITSLYILISRISYLHLPRSITPASSAIFVGALTESQMYHVSRSTEAVEFGSQASYSRRKTHLEEAGYIDTEKIPKDVGRPRQRLMLSGDIEQSTDAVVEVLHLLYRD